MLRNGSVASDEIAISNPAVRPKFLAGKMGSKKLVKVIETPSVTLPTVDVRENARPCCQFDNDLMTVD